MAEQQAKRVSAGERRFEDYLDGIVTALGHGGRAEPARAYCTGLLLPGSRKSIEPMAARLAPARVQAAHQSLHHVVATAEWNDAAVLAAVRERVLPAIERHGPIRYWIVDDTGFPKQGTHSVGVARQYCGQLGKQDNCQVAVTLSVANEEASLPIAYRLYLPKEWTRDPERCAKAGVPAAVKFATKPRLAIQQIRRALADGVPPGIVLMDAGYGNDSGFRDALREEKLLYVGGIQSSAKLWPPGMAPLPPKPPSGRGRPPRLLRRSPEHQPLTAKALAKSVPATAWRRVTWREGSQADLTSRFAALRVRPAHRDYWSSAPRDEEWLLIEWPESDTKPTKYWLSNLPAKTALKELVSIAKARWRIERDFQELKQEIGLGHFEGRGWRGFHHHAAFCIAAYGFLVAERCLFPPPQRFERPRGQAPTLPPGFRPRGASAA
jgi:SRSO17 transposase